MSLNKSRSHKGGISFMNGLADKHSFISCVKKGFLYFVLMKVHLETVEVDVRPGSMGFVCFDGGFGVV